MQLMKQYVPDYQATSIFGCDLKRLGQTKTGPESTLDPKIFVEQGVQSVKIRIPREWGG